MGGADVCFAPVMTLAEARPPTPRGGGTRIEVDGQTQPAPAPRFSQAPADPPRPASAAAGTARVPAELGYAPERVAALRAAGVTD